MKKLTDFLNEAKNFAKGLKAGDTICVLPLTIFERKPIELKLVEIDDTNDKGEAWARVARNDKKITRVYLNFKADETEYRTIALTSGPMIDIIVGRTEEDIKEILGSEYSEKIKELADKISKSEIMLDKMKKEMDELVKKTSMDK